MKTRNRYATQGALIAHALLKRPMTYGQMLALGAGLSPWKRCQEYLRGHQGLILTKTTGRDGLIRWRVVRVSANCQ